MWYRIILYVWCKVLIYGCMWYHLADIFSSRTVPILHEPHSVFWSTTNRPTIPKWQISGNNSKSLHTAIQHPADTGVVGLHRWGQAIGRRPSVPEARITLCFWPSATLISAVRTPSDSRMAARFFRSACACICIASCTFSGSLMSPGGRVWCRQRER